MIERFLRYLLARFYPQPAKKWSRVEVIEIAREAGIILPWQREEAPMRPPETQLAMQQEHRGRAYSADPTGKTKPPPDLRGVVQELKELGAPFLLVCFARTHGSGATHGWCNGSNWGKKVLEELARVAELNFRQELEKCGMDGGPARKSHAGPKGYLE